MITTTKLPVMALTDGTFETLKKLIKNQFDLMLKSGKLGAK
jgi:hypothetical protein